RDFLKSPFANAFPRNEFGKSSGENRSPCMEFGNFPLKIIFRWRICEIPHWKSLFQHGICEIQRWKSLFPYWICEFQWRQSLFPHWKREISRRKSLFPDGFVNSVDNHTEPNG